MKQIPKYSARLVNAEFVSQKSGIAVDRIKELAETEFMPHWNVDGNLMFDWTEARRWIEANLTRRISGRPIPTHVCVISDRPTLEIRDLPLQLRNVQNIVEMTDLLGRHAGIYFLLLQGHVVYVGQSKNVCRRIGQHDIAKEFDRVLFMPWPASDLDRMEAAFIRMLTPYHNYDILGRQGTRYGVGEKPDGEIVSGCMNSANAFDA